MNTQEPQRFLDLNQIPKYVSTGHKTFRPWKKHCTRVFYADILLIVLSGVLRFCEDGVPVEVRGGEYYIQFRGLRQEGLVESDLPVYYYINFMGTATCSPSYALPRHGKFDMKKLAPLCERLWEIECGPFNNPLETSSCFCDILNQLYQYKLVMTDSAIAAQEICEYLEAHFTEDLSLDEVALRFSYSKDYVIRLFRRRYGITPYQYITGCRIGKAKAMLSGEKLTMHQIALNCGYTDFSTFYRAFLRITGMTPGEWKAQQSGEK